MYFAYRKTLKASHIGGPKRFISVSPDSGIEEPVVAEPQPIRAYLLVHFDGNLVARTWHGLQITVGAIRLIGQWHVGANHILRVSVEAVARNNVSRKR